MEEETEIICRISFYILNKIILLIELKKNNLFYVVLYTADDAARRLVQTPLYKTEGRGLDS